MTNLRGNMIRLAELSHRKDTPFLCEPDAAARSGISEELNLLMVRKLRLEGVLQPMGRQDWQLEAHLGATVQQACSVTLEPVTTRIDERVTRTYTANFAVPNGSEVEMPEDDTIDPLPETLNLHEVMMEALALALPAYPRADGAEAGTTIFTEPGKQAMSDADARPFAGLANLRDRLENKDEKDGS